MNIVTSKEQESLLKNREGDSCSNAVIVGINQRNCFVLSNGSEIEREQAPNPILLYDKNNFL